MWAPPFPNQKQSSPPTWCGARTQINISRPGIGPDLLFNPSFISELSSHQAAECREQISLSFSNPMMSSVSHWVILFSHLIPLHYYGLIWRKYGETVWILTCLLMSRKVAVKKAALYLERRDTLLLFHGPLPWNGLKTAQSQSEWIKREKIVPS